MENLSDKDRDCLEKIERYGCMVMHVMEEDDHPGFSYSVGIGKTHGKPEAIVYGLDRELSHWMINQYQERLASGESFGSGEFHEGFLEGFDVCFIEVDRKHYKEHFGWNIWLYSGMDFEAVQIVVPTTDGIWPWDDVAPEGFLRQQLMLGKKPGFN